MKQSRLFTKLLLIVKPKLFRKYHLHYSWIFIFAVLLIAHQNCAPVKFGTAPTVFSSSSPSSSDATGTGINDCNDGKSCPDPLVSAMNSCLFNGQTVANGQSVTAYQNSIPFGVGQACVSQSRTCNNGNLSGSYAFPSCSATGTVASCLFNGQIVASGQSVNAYQNSTVPTGQSCVGQSRTCNNGNLSGSYAFASCSVGAAASCLFNSQMVASGQSVNAYQSSTVPTGQSCVGQSRTCNNGNLSGSYAFASCTVGAAASCLFNGQTVASGQSVNAYQSSTVPTGQSCMGQSRICNNGNLSGSYTFASCSVGAAASCLFNGQMVASGQSVNAYQNSTVPTGQSCVGQARTCNNGNLSGTYTFASCSALGLAACLFNGQIVNEGQSVIAYSEVVATVPNLCRQEMRTCSNSVLSGSFTNSGCTQRYRAIYPLTCAGGNSTISGWYKSDLNRCADVSGINYWTQSLPLIDFYNNDINALRVDFLAAAQFDATVSLCFPGDTYITNTEYCQRNTIAPLPPRPNYKPTFNTATCIGQNSVQNQIIAYYKQNWNRCPDRVGLNYWEKQYAKSTFNNDIEKLLTAIGIAGANTNQVQSYASECLSGDTYDQAEGCISNGVWSP